MRTVSLGIVLVFAVPGCDLPSRSGVSPRDAGILGSPDGGPMTSDGGPVSSPDAAPVGERWRVPSHPFMAPSGRSNVHCDGYMSDTYELSGPTLPPQTATRKDLDGLCVSHTFDSKGQLWTLCIGAATGSRTLHVLDPNTLEPRASMALPAGKVGSFSGGGYFYMDHMDRAVIPTADRAIVFVGTDARSSQPVVESRTPLDAYLTPSADGQEDGIQSAIPDWEGNVWFVSDFGRVGAITGAGSSAASVVLASAVAGEDYANSLSVDNTGGVYVVSTKALYRYDRRSLPGPTWRFAYENQGGQDPKSGQQSVGSGTTPTAFGDDYVAIADNAKQMKVVVLRRSTGALHCEVPACSQDQCATENSLIAIARSTDAFSLIVENNFGYDGIASTLGSRTTTSGVRRIDVDAAGCRVVWDSSVASPSAVAKYSYGSNTIYTYAKDATLGWTLSAIGFDSGRDRVLYSLGSELAYNNHFSPVTLATEPASGRPVTYVGLISGIVRLGE